MTRTTQEIKRDITEIQTEIGIRRQRLVDLQDELCRAQQRESIRAHADAHRRQTAKNVLMAMKAGYLIVQGSTGFWWYCNTKGLIQRATPHELDVVDQMVADGIIKRETTRRARA